MDKKDLKVCKWIKSQGVLGVLKSLFEKTHKSLVKLSILINLIDKEEFTQRTIQIKFYELNSFIKQVLWRVDNKLRTPSSSLKGWQKVLNFFNLNK